MAALVVLLWALPALGQWTVPQNDIAQQVQQHQSWIVVPAGPASERHGEVSAALSGSLTKAGAKLVMDSTTLGDISNMSDADIINATQHLPITAIAIVRIFDDMAVVAFYDKGGKAVGGLAMKQGEAPSEVEPRVAIPSKPDNKPAEAAKPEESKKESRRLKPVPQAKTFEHEVTVERVGGQRFMRLKNGDEVTGAAIYEALGEDELSKKYNARARTKIALVLSGVGAFVLGGIMAGVGASRLNSIAEEEPEPTIFNECKFVQNEHVAERCQVARSNELIEDFNSDRRNRFQRAQLIPITGASFAALGVATVIIGLAINPHPLTLEELQRRARALNNRAAIRLQGSSVAFHVPW